MGSIIEKIVKRIDNYGSRLPYYIAIRGPWSRLLPDKLYLQAKYHMVFGRKLNLDKPERYNDKLQWLKLYDRKPHYSRMVDKAEVKEYVSSIIGAQYIIPTLGVWNTFEEIDFDKLPNQFVLKTTHDSGGIAICTDKSKFNYDKAKTLLNSRLKFSYYKYSREWPYKNVKPRIIAEQYLEDAKTSELRDYKFFCFDGEVKALFIATQRQSASEETKFDFFDENFNHLDIRNGHPNADKLPDKPQNFELMKKLATDLSKGFAHLRVDFYEANGSVYFGELTFTHWSGMVPFEPDEWDYKFGSWLHLPQ